MASWVSVTIPAGVRGSSNGNLLVVTSNDPENVIKRTISGSGLEPLQECALSAMTLFSRGQWFRFRSALQDSVSRRLHPLDASGGLKLRVVCVCVSPGAVLI